VLDWLSGLQAVAEDITERHQDYSVQAMTNFVWGATALGFFDEVPTWPPLPSSCHEVWYSRAVIRQTPGRVQLNWGCRLHLSGVVLPCSSAAMHVQAAASSSPAGTVNKHGCMPIRVPGDAGGGGG
jgi:hypothetical protein